MNSPRDILLVEDDIQLGELYKEVIELQSHRVTWLQDGHAAQEFLAQETPDMVLLDLHLPIVSGEQLLTQIKSIPRLANTVVVLLSADGLSVNRLQDQVDLALLKPVEYKQLVTLCDRLLNPKHS